MSFTVVIPYGGDAPGRAQALAYVQAHLTAHHPDWPVCVSSYDGSFPWSKGATVHYGVEAAPRTEGSRARRAHRHRG